MDGDKFWNEPNLSLTKVKRQHYVPQLLLRAFSLDDKIRVVDLNDGKEYRTSTANVAIESHFYNENVADIQLSTEDWLSRLEGYATPVVEKLLNDPTNIMSLSIEEEFFIARFLAALRIRTPAFRDYNDKMITSLLGQIKDMAKKQIYHQHDKKEADSIWEKIKDNPNHWWFNEEKPWQSATTTNFMLGEVQGLANLLWGAPWCIGMAPDSIQLYTSDNPVAGYLRPVRPWWEGAAFASFTYFVPLSPKVLLIPHEYVLKEREEITATRLLITLQRMTDKQRLQAKEDLGLQMGYFIAANDDNKLDYPAMTIFNFSMRADRTAFELYKIYKQSLPVWFWSGIPDKGKTVRNKTVDREEIKLVENYLTYTELDSLDAYVAKGTTGWVINCTARNFHKYKKLFSKMIESFCIEDAED